MCYDWTGQLGNFLLLIFEAGNSDDANFILILQCSNRCPKKRSLTSLRAKSVMKDIGNQTSCDLNTLFIAWFWNQNLELCFSRDYFSCSYSFLSFRKVALTHQLPRPHHNKSLNGISLKKEFYTHSNQQAAPITVHWSICYKLHTDELTTIRLHNGKDINVKRLFCATVNSMMMGHWCPKRVEVEVLKHYCDCKKVLPFVKLHSNN